MMKKKKLYTAGAAILFAISLFTHGCGSESEEGISTEIHAEAAFDTETDAALSSDSGRTTEQIESEEGTPASENLPSAGADESGAPKADTQPSDTKKPNAGSTSGAASGTLHVDGTKLTDSSGQPIQLKGISTHGLAWFPDYVNQDCFKQLKEEWHINVIRLAMYTAEYGGYCSGGDPASLKELVKKGVEYATAADLYVIIDWHILSDGNPNTHLEEAKDFFAEMAELYAGYHNVLYEICNEPNGGTSWSDIKSYAEEVIPVIRAYDENGIIIVGTPNWSQYVDQAAADPISGYDNIMYSLHFYAATHKDYLRNTMVSAIEAGLPVFVSEYGICDASGNGSIDESQANQWVSTMDKYGVSYVAWNLSNKAETSAILNSSCSKTSGFTENDLSASGKWLYHMLTGENPPAAAEAPADSAQDSKPDNAVPESSPAPETPVSLGSGDITFTAEIINSWESDGKSFYQYELTLHNTSGKDCEKWTVNVPFSETFTLTDSWNGDYSVSGNTLQIICKDYNGSIPSGGSINNIGFIISGGSTLKVLN